MMRFFSSISNSIQALFKPLKVIRDPYHHLPNFPIYGVTFDFTQLCPQDLSEQDKFSWVQQYAAKLPHDQGLLFKGQDNVAHFAYNQNGQVKQFALKNMQVAVNSQIYFNDQTPEQAYQTVDNIKTIGIALAEQYDEDMPASITLADSEALSSLKWEIYFQNKIITSEMIQAEQQRIQSAIDNIESATSCAICLDEYTHDKPPVLFNSGHTYHATCIIQHGDAQLQRHGNYIVDPLNRAKVTVSHGANYNDLMRPNLTLKGLLDDIGRYEKSTEKLLGIIEVLVAENNQLKEQLKETLKEDKQDSQAPELRIARKGKPVDPKDGSKEEEDQKVSTGLNFNH